MINTVIKTIDTSRKNDMVFSSWYEEILTSAKNVCVAEFVPRKTSLQRNGSNVPSESPQKGNCHISLIDSLLSQMKERF